MRLKGRYGIIDGFNVDVIINRGMLRVIKNDNKIGNVNNPSKGKDFEIIQTNEEYGLPFTHKYAFKYTDAFGNEQYVFANISNSEINKIKWMRKEWLIQKNGFKITVYGGLIVLATWAFITFIFQKNNIDHKAVKAPYKNQQLDSTLLLQSPSSSSIDSLKLDTTINL